MREAYFLEAKQLDRYLVRMSEFFFGNISKIEGGTKSSFQRPSGFKFYKL